jgi:type II secretory pathway component PulJ
MDKSTGIDYDRQVFVPPAQQPTAAPSPAGIFFFLAIVAAILVLGFIGYKAITQNSSSGSAADLRTLNEMQQRLSAVEERLAQAEKENRRRALVAQPASNAKKEEPLPAQSSNRSTPARTAYQVSISPRLPQPPRVIAVPDPATAQKIAGIQQGLGTLQNDTTANREAWQATTDKLTDVVGQIGTQRVQILRNQDEVNQLLAHSERTAIPFELLRGSDPQLIGPVHLGLKSTNQRSRRYTLCVYIEQACLELKDKALFEVAEFIVARDQPPLEIIATKVSKDGILGFLEVPRQQTQH